MRPVCWFGACLCVATCLTCVRATWATNDSSACVWDAGGELTVLPTPANYRSEAFGINDAGHVVGWMEGPLDGVSTYRGVVWYNNGGTYTRADLPDVNGTTARKAVDINNDDWIVGEFDRMTAGDGFGVFYYEPGTGPTNGTMHEVPMVGDYAGTGQAYMYPNAISDTGWVAGTFVPGDPYSDYASHGFRYDAYNQTAFADIGTLTGDASGRSSGYDVDSIGRTVGGSLNSSGSNRGVVYDVGTLSLLDQIDIAAYGITETGGHVVGSQYDPTLDEFVIRIITLEGPGAGVQTITGPEGAMNGFLGARDINDHKDVLATDLYGGYWYDHSADQWHAVTAPVAEDINLEAVSDTGLIAGTVAFDASRPLPIAAGGGSVVYKPTGFSDEGLSTAGMAPGAKALDTVVDLDDLSFVADDHGNNMATLVVGYDEADVLARDIDEASLRLYWLDEDLGEWVLAGRTSNLDQTTGQFVAGPATNVLGDWGVDVANDTVWANIDHASTYAIGGVPEPTTLAMLGLAAAVATCRCRRHITVQDR